MKCQTMNALLSYDVMVSFWPSVWRQRELFLILYQLGCSDKNFIAQCQIDVKRVSFICSVDDQK